MIPNYNSIRMLPKEETDKILTTLEPVDTDHTLLIVWVIGITLIVAGVIACIVL